MNITMFFALFLASLSGVGQPSSGVFLNSDCYELYAPTADDLSFAREEMELAVRRFEIYFGTLPPKIAVVLFSDVNDIPGYDFQTLYDHGLKVLPFLTRRSVSSASSAIEAISQIGAVITGGKNGFPKVIVTLPNKPTDVDLRPEDCIKAVNGEEVKTPVAVRDAINQVIAGSEARLTILRKGEEKSVDFICVGNKQSPKIQISSIGNRNDADDKAGSDNARPLSHEAGHVFFSAYIDKLLKRKPIHQKADGRKRSLGDYGHDAIPDWMDEAVAVLCEFPALQKRRTTLMDEKIDTHIPFSVFFEMEHPFVAEQRELIEKTGDFGKPSSEEKSSGNTNSVKIIRLSADDASGLISERTKLFYAQSLSLAQFLAAKESPRFIGRIADGLARGEPMEVILQDGKNLPNTVEELEKSWILWVKGG